MAKTGPITEVGKEKASRNSLKHGMTSAKLLVGDERSEDLEALRVSWFEAYEVSGEHAEELLNKAVHAEWRFLRIERTCDEMNQELFGKDAASWTEKDHKNYQLWQRYFTGAQRALDRDRRNVQQYRREQRADQREARLERVAGRVEARIREEEQKAAAEAKADLIERLGYDPAQRRNEMTAQWVQIQEVGGSTEVRFSPSTEELLRKVENHHEKAVVLRSVDFVEHRLTPEYGHFAKRMAPLGRWELLKIPMTVKSFRVAAEREKVSGFDCWEDLEGADRAVLLEMLGMEKLVLEAE